MDKEERLAERLAIEGDLESLGRLAFLKIRRGDWSDFVTYRLASGTPRRNLELAWHLGHPGMRSVWNLEDFQQTGTQRIRPLIGITELSSELTAVRRLGAVMDNCFYALDLLWGLRVSAVSSLYQDYIDGTNLLEWEDFDALCDLDILPTHEQMEIINHQDNQLLKNISLIDNIDKVFDYTHFINIWRTEDLDYPEVITDSQFDVLIRIANALCSIYYLTDETDVSTDFLHAGRFSEILGNLANRMTKVTNIVGLSLDYAIEAETLKYLAEQGIPVDYDSDVYKNRRDLLCHEKSMELAERLLYDERGISPEIESLFGA